MLVWFLLFSLVLWIHGIFFYYIKGEIEQMLLLGNVFLILSFMSVISATGVNDKL